MTAQDSDQEAQKFIMDKLTSVLNIFIAEAREKESLCECNDIDFTPGRRPSYDSRLAQRFYLLKYMPAYMAEYHWL